MALMESIRKRFSHRLESHQIDEDYTTPSRSSSSVRDSTQPNNISNTINPNANNVDRSTNSFVYNVVDPYDPSEMVPSYETSQLLYEQQQTAPDRNGSIPNSSNISRTISRTNSFATITPLTQNQGPNANQSSNNGSHKNNTKNSLKMLGLKFLNARQHFMLACCRDISLIPCLIGLIQSWNRVFLNSGSMHNFVDDNLSLVAQETGNETLYLSMTSARLSEHFLTGVWCIVAGYLSFSVLDGLMIRWIVTYLTLAAIVRMLSMSTIMITIEQYLLSTFTADGYKYGLHIWILISCCLTLLYIGQNFVTLNLDLKGNTRARFFDFYNIAVFAVVPVGLASFITMIGLLRSLLILRLDIDQNGLP